MIRRLTRLSRLPLMVAGLLLLSACVNEAAPPRPIHEVAVNERLELYVGVLAADARLETKHPAYALDAVAVRDGHVVFDLKRQPGAVPGDVLEVLAVMPGGRVAARQSFQVNSELGSSDLVMVIDGYSHTAIERALGAPFELKAFRETPSYTVATVDIGAQTSSQALATLATANHSLASQSDEIVFAFGPDFAYKLDAPVRSHDPTCDVIPGINDYALTDGWDKLSEGDLLTYSGAAEAQSRGATGSGVVVAVLDSGYGTGDVFDCPETAYPERHGTHVADIVGHLAPQAEIVSYPIFSSTGTASTTNLTNTFSILDVINDLERQYLLAGRKVVLNLSFSASAHPDFGPDLALWAALKELEKRYENHLLVVASAGNNGLDPDEAVRSEVLYPSGFTKEWLYRTDGSGKLEAPIYNLLSVGTGGLKGGAYYSAQLNPEHERVDLLGFGVRLCLEDAQGCRPDASDVGLTGASYAVPSVAAVAALTWQSCQTFSTYDLMNKLIGSAKQSSNSNWKLISADAGLDCEVPPPPPPAEPLDCELGSNEQAIMYGTYIRCDVASVTESDTFRFEARRGDKIYYTITDLSFVGGEGVCFELLQPDGTPMPSSAPPNDSCTDWNYEREDEVTQDGVHTFNIRATRPNLDYGLALERLSPASPNAPDLGFGTTKYSAIELAGDIDLYVIDAYPGARARIALEELSGEGIEQFCIQVLDASGAEVTGGGKRCTNGSRALSPTFEEGGTYTVVVTGLNYYNAFTYALALQCRSSRCEP